MSGKTQKKNNLNYLQTFVTWSSVDLRKTVLPIPSPSHSCKHGQDSERSGRDSCFKLYGTSWRRALPHSSVLPPPAALFCNCTGLSGFHPHLWTGWENFQPSQDCEKHTHLDPQRTPNSAWLSSNTTLLSSQSSTMMATMAAADYSSQMQQTKGAKA